MLALDRLEGDALARSDIERRMTDGQAGYSIAKAYGLSLPALFELLTRWGIHAPDQVAQPEQPKAGQKGIGDDPAAKARILEMRQAGATLAVIAAEFGLSRERIRQLCDRWGCPFISVRPDPQVELPRLIERIRQGEQIQDLAAELGIGAQWVSDWCRKLGVDLEAAKAEGRTHRLDGQRFGDWEVIAGSYRCGPGGNADRGQVQCRCVCGTVRDVLWSNLRRRISLGCGCRTRTGRRIRVPWQCQETGERIENTAATARRLGVSISTLSARIQRGGQAYRTADGHHWLPLLEEAVPHNSPKEQSP